NSEAKLHVHVGGRIYVYEVGTDIQPLALARRMRLLPATATVRFEQLTEREARLLPGSVCSRIDLEAWCACYHDYGNKNYRMNNFSPECVRAIPVDLFNGLRPEDIPMLGNAFLEAVHVKQIIKLKEEARLALSDRQLMSLITSDMGGLAELGTNCRGLSQ